MRHTECRAAVLNDEVGDDARAHLEGCPACATFEGDVARVTAAAPTLAPGRAPVGLADRVVERLAEAPARPAGAPAPRRPRDRRWARIAVAAAAVVAIVAGLIVAGGPGGPRAALADAADRTEEAGTAKVHVTGSARFAVSTPPSSGEVGSPDFSSVPEEVRASMQREWERQVGEFEAEVDRFLRQVDEQLDRASRQMDDAFDGFSGEPREPATAPSAPPAPRAPSAPPAPPARDRPAPPTRASVAVAIDGSGEVAFESGLRLEGTVRASGGAPAPYALVAADGETALRAPNGTWARLRGVAGPIGSAVLRSDAVISALRSPEGDVEELGREDVGAQQTTHYRFDVQERTVVSGGDDVRWTADAWIDDEGLVRRMRFRSSDALSVSGSWATTLDLALSGFGADVGVDGQETTGAEIAAPADSSVVLYPFGPSASASASRR